MKYGKELVTDAVLLPNQFGVHSSALVEVGGWCNIAKADTSVLIWPRRGR